MPDLYPVVDRFVQLSYNVTLQYFKDAFQYRQMNISAIISRSGNQNWNLSNSVFYDATLVQIFNMLKHF